VQNAFVESFHGRSREECLNASWFRNLFEARAKITAWKKEYNEERPHSSLGYLTPQEFAQRVAALRSPAAPCACHAPYCQRLQLCCQAIRVSCDSVREAVRGWSEQENCSVWK
jgi:Integrase core domain